VSTVIQEYPFVAGNQFYIVASDGTYTVDEIQWRPDGVCAVRDSVDILFFPFSDISKIYQSSEEEGSVLAVKAGIPNVLKA
jgi:hypothetical protein